MLDVDYYQHPGARVSPGYLQDMLRQVIGVLSLCVPHLRASQKTGQMVKPVGELVSPALVDSIRTGGRPL